MYCFGLPLGDQVEAPRRCSGPGCSAGEPSSVESRLAGSDGGHIPPASGITTGADDSQLLSGTQQHHPLQATFQ